MGGPRADTPPAGRPSGPIATGRTRRVAGRGTAPRGGAA
ncbi:hypothetical protein HMPREF0682_2759 [Propionibacterium acidifaciens F0233]|uniref:Uncharacterized protein n=1 Tax=Propionibacterium acidifaciens F0233 TaxID=553198 RepID=U2Q5C2_9ACTN|nr:hypothetical protein HMPREF0682_2759 [Propionibacterium acidifaciens F0233]